MTHAVRHGGAVLVVLLAACGKPPQAASSASGPAPDTSIATQLARFRAELRDHPDSLDNALPSRDSLVRRFATAVTAHDTSALVRLAMTKAEFAYLYYPVSPMARPPYELEPQLTWMQIAAQRERGLRRLLRRHATVALRYVGYECPPAQSLGPVTLYDRCTVRWIRPGGDTVSERLFGSIIERGGVFKFVGYGNAL